MNEMSDLQLRILEKQKIECSDVDALLGELVEEALPATLQARIEDHIAQCPECQDGEKAYREVILLARSLKRHEPQMPTAAKNRLRAALNARLGLALPPVS